MSVLTQEKPITDEEKLREVKREIEYRWFVYPKRVAAGKMKQAEMDRKLAVMLAIRDDIERRINGRML